MSKYRLIAMDLDGTLTQHKSKLEEKNTELLRHLQERYLCVIVGAGSCERIYSQINQFPIDIIGNYGMQMSIIEKGQYKLIRNIRYNVDKYFFEQTILEIRKKTGYMEYKGDSLEFHSSGAVTFPLLGTKANLNEKLAFDPLGEKRSKIYDYVSSAFEGYNCFIGGTSSFDIVDKKFDKYTALIKYAEEKNIMKNEILFIGDDFKLGGNDEQIKLGGIEYIKISDYKFVTEILASKGII